MMLCTSPGLRASKTNQNSLFKLILFLCGLTNKPHSFT